MRRTWVVALLAALAVAGTLLLPAAAVGRVETGLRLRAPRTVANPYIGTRPTSGAGGVSAAALNLQSTSTNWAGYTAQTSFPTGASTSVTDVKGSWIVPRVTGGTGDAYSANWIGIDGYSSPTVEQLGTEQDWISGRPTYSAWWEMYPDSPVTIDSLSISPGDLMSAEVRWISGSQFSLTLTDVTKSQTFQTVRTMAGGAQRRSAEWVVEAPADASGVLPLTDLGPSPFTLCDVTINGVEGSIGDPAWQNDAMTLVAARGGTTLASPSALAAGGTAFVVTEPGSPDGVAPTTVSDAVAAYDNVAVIHLSAVDNSGGSGVAATYYKVDGGANQSGSLVTVSTYGMHLLTFWSVDVAGNVEPGNSASFMVNDTIPPVTSSDAGSAYAGPASIRLTAADNVGGSGVATTYYMVDGVVQKTYVGTPVTITAEGPHKMTYWSVDNAGNVEATRSAGFAISAPIPVATKLTMNVNPTSLSLGHSAHFFGVIAPNVPDRTPIAFMVRKAGQTTWTRVAPYVRIYSSHHWSFYYHPATRGTYYFKVQSVASPRYGAATSRTVKIVWR